MTELSNKIVVLVAALEPNYRGLVTVVLPESVTYCQYWDDLSLHGLHISPDLDTIIYTLGNEINPDTGWGLKTKAGSHGYGDQEN